MTYTVKYRKSGAKEWTTIKNVRGDGIMSETNTHRFFIGNDETRYEVPIAEMEFVFSKERFLLIKQNMDAQAGQTIPVKK